MCSIHDILLILGALGLLFILKEGTIFDKPRNFIKSKSQFFRELIECPMCLGFWVGFASKLFFLLLVHTHSLTIENIFISVFFGFMISLLGMITHNILDILDTKAFSLKKELIEKESNERWSDGDK